MLKHIVVWKFKDEAEGKSRAENCALVIVDTDNTDTLSAYANHPEHLKVVDYIKKVVEQRVAVDFTF